ncbi:MAG: hypothetical protein JSV74_05565 [Dehalococcoidia bacterium]|nr:MAG: hypothetical protein JSV74_05565 [Dehalococcoidia bacterium]
MKKAGSIILLICGIIALTGFFLPWIGDNITIMSGWGILSEYGINGIAQYFIFFIGNMLLLVLAIPTVIASMDTEESRKTLLSLSILASLGAAVGVGGATWLLSELISQGGGEIFQYGFYISFAAVVIGFIFGEIVAYKTAIED